MNLAYLFEKIIVDEPEQVKIGLNTESVFTYHYQNKSLPIPLLADINLEEDANNCVLAAGADRNILVYDEKADHTMSNRLLSLMQLVQRRNSDGRRLDMFFVPENANIDKNLVMTYEFVTVPGSEYQRMKQYYLETLKGVLAPDKTELVIGITWKDNNFINPSTKDGIKQGVAVVDTSCILLGSF